MARRDMTGERIYTATPQEEIEICLDCPLGDCRQASMQCPLQRYMHNIGRKNIGGVKVQW